MSLPEYSELKSSGLAWLGHVPRHWEVSRVKHVAPFQVGWTPPTGDDSNFQGDNLWANISDLDARTISSTAKRISDHAAKVASMNITPKGSLLFSFKLSVGTVSFAGVDLYTNEAIASFLDAGRTSLGFSYYAFPLFVVHNATTNIYGARILNQALIRNASLVVPPPDEQTQIASFLDFETAKIDTLIDKQLQLIALLEEKRQAVISHSVTKGLNPDAPMRDSGVEWLGEVPAHWKSGKMKFFAELRSGHTPSRSKPEFWDDCYIPWFSLADVWQLRDGRRLYLGETEEKISDLGLANSAADLLPPGTVILSRTASVGFSGIMQTAMTTTQDFVNWIPGPSLSSEYLLFVFRGMEAVFEKVKMGSTHKTIYMPDVRAFDCPVPPREEQASIVAYIRSALDAYDAASERATVMVSLLRERRIALIFAAVTGKIDVRNWKAPASGTEVA